MGLWIKCNDKMPEPYTFVLVFCQTLTEQPSSYSLARYNNYGGFWEIIGNGEAVWSDLFWGINDDKEITHWMELPTPPPDIQKVSLPKIPQSMKKAYNRQLEQYQKWIQECSGINEDLLGPHK